VLLGADDEANVVWGPLVESLGPHYRLVVPQLPSADVDATTWLRALIEGLGLATCTLITGPLFSDAAVELLTSADANVEKIVVLDAATDAASDPRVLRVEPTWSPERAIDEIEQFIGAGTPNG
jgi:hypothetical protein